MNGLQWALLVVGAIAVIAIYIASRRRPPGATPAAPETRTAPRAGTDQMDMFSRGSHGSEFDEFGVGKPRKRPSAPPGDTAPTQESRTMFPGVDKTVAPVKKERAAPAFVKAEPKAQEEMIVTLLIAEREGTAIFGPKIHEALDRNGLKFGDRAIYHRLANGQAVFSVASLVKPGFLDPAAQNGFSTPGLTVFTVLPGPVQPLAALKDMIATARNLAGALNAEVFDVSRQLFDETAERGLTASVEAWVKRNG